MRGTVHHTEKFLSLVEAACMSARRECGSGSREHVKAAMEWVVAVIDVRAAAGARLCLNDPDFVRATDEHDLASRCRLAMQSLPFSK